MIVISRMKNWYESQLLDQQQGFRSKRGTSDGIFIIKRVQQITNKMKKPTYALFVDLSAAFDHVERSWVFKSIKILTFLIIFLRLPENYRVLLVSSIE